MATGVEKAADRLQAVHNLHLLVCIVVAVFGVIDILDSDRRSRWIDVERRAVEPISKNALQTVAALREALYRDYGMQGSKRFVETEIGRVGALVSDIYQARGLITGTTTRVLLTVSSRSKGPQNDRVLIEIANHLESIKTIFSYGLANDQTLEGLILANPDLGTIGEPQALLGLSIEDLARVGFVASASPRTIVERLSPIAMSEGPLTHVEVDMLAKWLGRSKAQLENLRPLRSRSRVLWDSWISYAAESARSSPSQVAVLTPEMETIRRLKASASTSQTIEDLHRSLRYENAVGGLAASGQQRVKVPGLDFDMRFRYLLVVFPWIVAFLLAFKYATVHQIRFSALAAQVPVADEVSGTLPLYRWTGPLATLLVIVFVVLTEIGSILIIPALGYLLRAQLESTESYWFWAGCALAFALWLTYAVELYRTRGVLFAKGSAVTSSESIAKRGQS